MDWAPLEGASPPACPHAPYLCSGVSSTSSSLRSQALRSAQSRRSSFSCSCSLQGGERCQPGSAQGLFIQLHHRAPRVSRCTARPRHGDQGAQGPVSLHRGSQTQIPAVGWGRGPAFPAALPEEIPKGGTSESQMSPTGSLSKSLMNGSVIYIPFW